MSFKVLAIYTFTAPCPVEPFEPAARKLMGYTTVSHFNLVHVDCHSKAVREARGREEWDSAMLQNANTRYNFFCAVCDSAVIFLVIMGTFSNVQMQRASTNLGPERAGDRVLVEPRPSQPLPLGGNQPQRHRLPVHRP